MLFPTLDFLLFFIGVVVGMVALRGHHAAGKRFLVAASYVFYAQWNWHYCLLLAFISLTAWVGGLGIGAARRERTRRWIAGVVIAVLLGQLAYFKYFDFLVGGANAAAAAAGVGWRLPFVEVILPVGISFVTFHGISYIVDVRRGDADVCRRLSDIMLYLSFFPQLVAGPIVRAAAFLPQLAAPPAIRPPIAPAVTLILGGLFKKVVLANYLATDLVDPVFFDPTQFGTGDLLLATYAYAVQIYCDFSAYSDIAIGLAALLGYRFPANFDQPYRAASLREFWRRWHISLSFWLRDYLYKPLGGDRHGTWRTYLNLAITMLLGGLWHGASWKFVAWGGLHGAGLALERGFGRRRTEPSSRLGRIAATVLVFHFVCLGWILFRADSGETAWLFLKGIATGGPSVQQVTPFTVFFVILGLSLHVAPKDLPWRVGLRLEPWPRWSLGCLAGVATITIDALGPPGVAPFIYFQF
jgi:D-alanyl-lipoteichoic acid acyltransferase DltB (MBOAT superfamily)